MARVYILGGKEITVRPGLKVIDKINARSTVSLTSDDIGDLANVFNGQLLDIYKDESMTTKLFSGVLKKVTRSEESPGYLKYVMKFADNSAKADKRVIAKVYENKLQGDIVKDFITEKLGVEGVTEGAIEDGPLISKAVFNYNYVSDALDYLKKTTGFIWNIDNDDKLNMYSRSSFNAPFDLDDTVQHVKFKHEKNMDQYRNTEYTRGGKTETVLQENVIPTPEPDGKSRSFVLRLPVADKPIIRINTVPINPNDIGVNGIDTNKKWYYNVGSQVITQDNSQTVLVSTDDLECDFIGLRDLFLLVDDPVEVNTRKTIEFGTSGIYEHLTIEKSLTTEQQGIEFTNGLLETYGTITDKITYSTNVEGLKAGMIQRVNKSLYDINSDFLIESVVMRGDGPDDITYDITALDGAAIGGWEEFFKEITRKQAEFIINENEVIVILQNQTETNLYSGSYEIQIFTPPQCNIGLKCGTFKVGGNVVSEVIIND